jgi:hypothetical protein
MISNNKQIKTKTKTNGMKRKRILNEALFLTSLIS